MDTIERKLRDDVEEYGWHVINVVAEERAPFSYSTGIYHSLGHPEIVILGLQSDVAHRLINNVGEQVREGKRFAHGAVSPDFLEGYDCTFREVPRRVYEDYFGRAIDFYDGEEFPVLQLVYPDRQGRWPWEEGVGEDFRLRQPVLSIPPVHCDAHGERRAAFVCQHLVGGSGLGFITPDPENREEPSAWCAECENARREQGEWNDVSQAVVQLKLLCDVCFEAVRLRNQL